MYIPAKPAPTTATSTSVNEEPREAFVRSAEFESRAIKPAYSEKGVKALLLEVYRLFRTNLLTFEVSTPKSLGPLRPLSLAKDLNLAEGMNIRHIDSNLKERRREPTRPMPLRNLEPTPAGIRLSRKCGVSLLTFERYHVVRPPHLRAGLKHLRWVTPIQALRSSLFEP